jgi:hypothetical protein
MVDLPVSSGEPLLFGLSVARGARGRPVRQPARRGLFRCHAQQCVCRLAFDTHQLQLLQFP